MSGELAKVDAPSTADTALEAITKSSDGVMALAFMDETDFKKRIDAMRRGLDRQRRIQRELMVGPSEDNPAGEDYGIIPGTKKPTLLKPGAEKLCNFYGLVPTFDIQVTDGDGETRPHLRVLVTCTLHRSHDKGPVVGQGMGAANSWEKKHRYRASERTCPACGAVGTIKKSSFPDRQTGDKGWYCHNKAGGCGANFHSADKSITEQQGGRVDNPDPYEVENTLVKMASKRAFVDATLRATATSGLFTQDAEEQGEPAGPPPPAPPQRPAPQAQKPTAQPQQPPVEKPPTPRAAHAAEAATAAANGGIRIDQRETIAALAEELRLNREQLWEAIRQATGSKKGIGSLSNVEADHVALHLRRALADVYLTELTKNLDDVRQFDPSVKADRPMELTEYEAVAALSVLRAMHNEELAAAGTGDVG